MSTTEKNKVNREQNQMSIRKITYGALLLAIGIALPQAFHLTGGTASGAVFLPMHIPVLIAGLLLGPLFGAGIGAMTPLISFMITGMPIAARMPFMILELATYGAVAGFLYRKAGLSRFQCAQLKSKKTENEGKTKTAERLIGLYISLILSMLIGRAVYALSLLVMNRLFGIEKADPASVWASIVTGMIGIGIQLIVIPPIVLALDRGGRLYGLRKESHSKTE